MLRTNTNEFLSNFSTYILSNVTNEEGEDFKNIDDCLTYIFNRFRSEYGWKIAQGFSKQEALKDWLSGLAINIDFYYNDILEASAKMHGTTLNFFTEKEKDTICQNWFNFVAVKLMQLNTKKNNRDIKRAKIANK